MYICLYIYIIFEQKWKEKRKTAKQNIFPCKESIEFTRKIQPLKIRNIFIT